MKNKEVKNEVKAEVKDVKVKVNNLAEFTENYGKAATPLIYFENGMRPVPTPIMMLAKDIDNIVETNNEIVNSFVDKNDTHGLIGFIGIRRDSAQILYRERVEFLARSLSYNISEKIKNIIKEITKGDIHLHYMQISEMIRCISDPMKMFLNIRNFHEDASDAAYSHLATTAITPAVLSQLFDICDEYATSQIKSYISFNKNDESKAGGSVDELHFKYLEKAFPVFEMAKNQLDWMTYTLRSECASIFSRMAAHDVDPTINRLIDRNVAEMMKSFEESTANMAKSFEESIATNCNCEHCNHDHSDK